MVTRYDILTNVHGKNKQGPEDPSEIFPDKNLPKILRESSMAKPLCKTPTFHLSTYYRGQRTGDEKKILGDVRSPVRLK
jgi:hypothetical protein